MAGGNSGLGLQQQKLCDNGIKTFIIGRAQRENRRLAPK
jgi:hypothetical protein